MNLRTLHAVVTETHLLTCGRSMQWLQRPTYEPVDAPCSGYREPLMNLWTRHAVVTETHL